MKSPDHALASRSHAYDALLGAAADVLPELLAVIDARGRLVASNKAWRTRAAGLGLVPKDLGGDDDYLAAAAALPESAPPRVLARAVREVLGHPHQSWATEQHFGLDDKEGWFRCTVHAFESNEILCALLSLEDVSVHKETELELSRRSELLAEAERIAQLGSWELELATGRVRWSDQPFRMFGFDPASEPTLEMVMERVVPRDRESVRRDLEEAIARKVDSEREFHVVDQVSGEELTFLSKGHVVLDPRGAVVRLVGTVQDITARTALEESLRESELVMRELLEERQQLARDLHDGIIQMIYAVGMMLEEANRILEAAPRQAAQRIARAINELNGVIRDVRRHIIGVESTPMSGAQLRAELTKIVQSMELSPDLRFNLKIDPAAAILLSAEEVTQLLYIAREAMSNSLRHARARHGSVTLSLRDTGVRLEVSDDGMGFEPAKLAASAGGLQNMSSRARMLGATLTVRSRPQGGTHVVLEIPKEIESG